MRSIDGQPIATRWWALVMTKREALVVAMIAAALVALGCSSHDRVIAVSAALDSSGRSFSVDPPLAVRGHFNEICVDLPATSVVDFHTGVVVLPSGSRARMSASLWPERGERVDLMNLSLLVGTDGPSACLSDAPDPQGGPYSRVAVTSSESFTSPRIRWVSTDKL